VGHRWSVWRGPDCDSGGIETAWAQLRRHLACGQVLQTLHWMPFLSGT